MPFENQSLIARLEVFLGHRYRWFTLCLALALVLLLALAAWAERASGRGQGLSIGMGHWMLGLCPTMTVYILVVHPLMYRRWRRAVQALQALAPAADGVPPLPRASSKRGEWIAMLAGLVFGLSMAGYMTGAEGWLQLYAQATSALMFALLASVIYGGLQRTRLLAAYARDGLQLDVFDGHLLTPFARWGQSLSLSFVGGICLSLVFQSYQSLRSLGGVFIYSSLIVVALTLFFKSVWAIHVALTKAQDRELLRVRRDLATARAALHRHWAAEPELAPMEAYLPVAACGTYEQQVMAASTWPFNPTIVRQLLASAVAPLAIYVLKLAFGLGAGL